MLFCTFFLFLIYCKDELMKGRLPMENNSQNTEKYGGTGYLVVRVATANGAIPLEGARVTVRGSEPDNSSFYHASITGMSGLSEKISLPAPKKELSEIPNGARPYSLYSIDVFRDGYNDVFFVNVPIFDTITSIQPVNMIPKVDNEYPDSFAPYDSIVIEGEAPDL